MRFFVKKYGNDKTFALETSNDGTPTSNKVGSREVGERISAYAEFVCDDNETGYDRAIEAIDLLKQELERRKQGG
jgi:hypothetical protein